MTLSTGQQLTLEHFAGLTLRNATVEGVVAGKEWKILNGDGTSAYEHLTAPESPLFDDGLRDRFVHVTCISANQPRWFPHTYWIGVVIVRRVLAQANR